MFRSLKAEQDAIYRAGLEMGNLTTEEVTAMSHEECVMLLKDQILQFTQELGYDTFALDSAIPNVGVAATAGIRHGS